MAARSSSAGVNVYARTEDFDRGMKSAAASAKVFEREIARQQKTTRDQAQAIGDLGQGVFVAGAAITAGFAVATKSAMDWESAFAGVRKTVDGTPEELAAVETQLLNMARSLPASQVEIAGVAEAAGQLGVKKDDIAGFTRTMVDLGETTNLSSEEAATALARFSNVMGTTTADSDRLGSAIVALGNNSATTEQEIVDMALRLAGAGRQIGLSEGDVLGMAAALSSVGIEAEAGGSAFSKAMVTISQAVRNGGEELDGFAQVAGVSSEEFARAYEEDATSAILMFVSGLDRMKQSGGDVFGTLEDLELGELRVRDALLRASAASDGFTGSIELGNSAFQDNNALAAEAATRYETTEAKVRMAWNALNELAIGVGNTVLPMLGDAAEDFSTLAGMLNDLPDGAQTALAVVGVLAGGIALAGGAAAIAVPRLVALYTAVGQLGPAGMKAQAGMRALSAAAGPIGTALTVLTVAGGLAMNSYIDQKQAVDEYVASLEEATGAVTEATRVVAIKALQDTKAYEAGRDLGLSEQTITDAALGSADALARVAEVTARVTAEQEGGTAKAGDLGRALMGTAIEGDNLALSAGYLNDALGVQNGRLTEAQAKAAEFNRAMASGSGDTDEFTRAMGVSGEAAGKAAVEYYEARDALEAAGVMAGQSTGVNEDLAAAMELATEEARTFEEQISDLEAALASLFDDALSQQEAADNTAQGFQDMADKLTEAKDAAKAADETWKPLTESIYAQTQAGRDHRDQLDAMIVTIGAEAVALAENGAAISDVTAKTNGSREALILQAMEWGYTREEAEEYTASLAKVPDTVATTIDLPGMAQAKRDALILKANLDNIPRSVTVSVTTYATTVRQDIAAANRGGTQPNTRNARGGRIRGSGTDTSDSINTWLSNDEYVIKAASARAIGYDNLDALNAGEWRPQDGPESSAAVVRMTAGAAGAGGSSMDYGQLARVIAASQPRAVPSLDVTISGADGPRATADELIARQREAVVAVRGLGG